MLESSIKCGEELAMGTSSDFEVPTEFARLVRDKILLFELPCFLTEGLSDGRSLGGGSMGFEMGTMACETFNGG